MWLLCALLQVFVDDPIVAVLGTGMVLSGVAIFIKNLPVTLRSAGVSPDRRSARD